jgi:aryl-alcohol dehydrogenase-like predicted oxidoreductase
MKTSDRRSLSRTGLALPVFGLGCSQAGGLYRAMDGLLDARAPVPGDRGARRLPC